MELILTEGCVCDSLTIDDKEARDCSNEELSGIIKKVLDKEKSKFNLIKLLGMVIEIFGEYSTDKIIIETDKYGLITIMEQDQDGADVITVGERNANDFAEEEQDGADVITVGERNVNDFAEEEIRDMIIAVISSRDDNADLIWALRGLVQILGRYKFCYHCDECGDNVVEYKMEI